MAAFPWHCDVYGLQARDEPAPGHARDPGPWLRLLVYDQDGALLVRARADGALDLPPVPLNRPETRAVESAAEFLEALHLGLCDVTPIAIHNAPLPGGVLVLRLRVPPGTPLRDDREWEWFYDSPPSWPAPLRELVEQQRDDLPPLEEIAVNEVEEQSKRRWQYAWIHRRFVRPTLGGRASSRLRAKVLELIGTDGPVVDFACGDDLTLAIWARQQSAAVEGGTVPGNGSWALANDVAFVSSAPLRAEAGANLFFSSHDLRHLPYGRRFRVGLLKNTLHHLPTVEVQRATLTRLLDGFVDRLVVVEIQDPAEGGWRSRLWNAYYRWVLGDEGDEFLGDAQFRGAVEATGRLVDKGVVNTSRGPYFWAVLDNEPTATGEGR